MNRFYQVTDLTYELNMLLKINRQSSLLDADEQRCIRLKSELEALRLQWDAITNSITSIYTSVQVTHLLKGKPESNSGLEECRRLVRLIRNLGYYHEAICTDNQLFRFNANIVLEAIYNCIKPHLERIGFLISLLPLPTDTMITGNIIRITRILCMITENAMKFTAAKRSVLHEIRFELKLLDENISFIILDNGIGISNDLFPTIFNWFSKTDECSDGWGISLSIANELAKSINGTINVESRSNIGSKFTLDIKQNINEMAPIWNHNILPDIINEILMPVLQP